jgi:hypothetical protein
LPEEPSYLADAFRSQYNLIGLGTAIGFAILSGSALPLILAAGVELAVLPLVASHPRFQRLVRARRMEIEQEERDAKKQIESAEMIRALDEPERARYRGLETLAAEIRRNYRGLDASSQALLEEVVRKLHFLLAFYLRMRYSVARYDAYLQSIDPERLRERSAMLEHEAKEGPERVRQIKSRTREVLLKRLARYQKALENRQLIDAQTETVLEVLQLLRDQSVSMRDPRLITEQLDGLVHSAEETERGVRDMEALLADEHEALLPDVLGSDVEAELRRLGAEAEAAPARTAPPPLRLPSASETGPSPTRPAKKITH